MGLLPSEGSYVQIPGIFNSVDVVVSSSYITGYYLHLHQ